MISSEEETPILRRAGAYAGSGIRPYNVGSMNLQMPGVGRTIRCVKPPRLALYGGVSDLITRR